MLGKENMSMATTNQLRFHVPEPPARPGDEPDFS
jgi:hypothetical protein